MEQFIQFSINHWTLLLALVAIIFLLVIEETKKNVGGVTKISPQEAVNLINNDESLILDTRSKEIFAHGHLINSLNIPNNELDNNLNKLTKYKDRPIIIVCDLGHSSIKTGANLRKQGFARVYSLRGGFSAWQRDNLPTTINKRREKIS